MDRYISCKDAENAIRKATAHPLDVANAQHFIAAIRNVPAADVRPVVRGRWNRYEHDEELWCNYCSACNTYLPPGMDWTPNFCPNCGADMRDATNG